MPNVNDLGLIRDKILGITVISGIDGEPGTTVSYGITTEQSPDTPIGTFYVYNGQDAVGIPAGFGTIQALPTQNSTLAPNQQATSAASVTASGFDTAKNFDFSFTFGIPRGADGTYTASGTALGLIVDSSNGHLLLYSPDGGNHGIYLVDEDPNSPSYYATLGLDASYVGKLVFTY